MKLFRIMPVLALLYSCTTSQLPTKDYLIMIGELKDQSAVIQLRINEPGFFEGREGEVDFELRKVRNGVEASSKSYPAKAVKDYIAKVLFQDLEANTEYICNTKLSVEGREVYGPVARFKTLPGKLSSAKAEIVVVTGMNYAKFHGDDRIDKEQHLRENRTVLPEPYKGVDKALGYPALETIRSFKPDIFIGTGDNVYYDTPDTARAETKEELRLKWQEQFYQQRYIDLFKEVPTYWMVDDHDYRIDDGDNSGDHEPSPQLAREMMLEQLPIAEHENEDALTYRTVRVNKDLQLWFVENRMYRSDNTDKDGPNKTIWGKAQKEWLKKGLLASDAKYKLLVTPTPMIGPDGNSKIDNHCNINGFQYERDEFFSWLNKTGLSKNGFYIVCGDRHWQYHSISSEGIEEFSCGALQDVNSRLGVLPGDPTSTDPEGKVKQVYTQKVRSGGFLSVKIEKSKLSFNFYDEDGLLLYREVK